MLAFKLGVFVLLSYLFAAGIKRKCEKENEVLLEKLERKDKDISDIRYWHNKDTNILHNTIRELREELAEIKNDK